MGVVAAGGIMKCDVIAAGIVNAAKGVSLTATIPGNDAEGMSALLLSADSTVSQVATCKTCCYHLCTIILQALRKRHSLMSHYD